VRNITAILILILFTQSAFAEVYIGGFLQGLYGGRLHEDNPTSTEYTASETRMQLKLEHFGDGGEFFGRVDLVYDGTLEPVYEWELREAYFKFRLGGNFDFKVGRQVLTWGTGDLIFINDVFAKDYTSFFVGRDDQHLKAPQNAIRIEYYGPVGSVTLVWTPRFEPNRLPTGQKLSFFNPMAGRIVGEDGGMAPLIPEARFKNSETAIRYSRSIEGFSGALYYYRGFYKNPMGFDMNIGSPVYPRLHVYGASVRGQIAGGIAWIEGGYFDSRDDTGGGDPFMPNSSASGLLGFERQVATSLTANVQWQIDYMTEYEKYEAQQSMAGGYVRDEMKHLLTSRVTKLLFDELLALSGFVFYSPSDEDGYARMLAEYKYTDEIRLAVGANIFGGDQEAGEFGQFKLNDNVYVKMTYGF
jgi:hypothetical protein